MSKKKQNMDWLFGERDDEWFRKMDEIEAGCFISAGPPRNLADFVRQIKSQTNSEESRS